MARIPSYPRHIDFRAINAAALAALPRLLPRLLPSGRRIGREWVCGNLRGEPGNSCCVNLETGRWADFATGERGGDPVSLCAAVWRISQVEAARRLRALLGMEGSRHG
jgi:hypothetical protein